MMPQNQNRQQCCSQKIQYDVVDEPHAAKESCRCYQYLPPCETVHWLQLPGVHHLKYEDNKAIPAGNCQRCLPAASAM